MDYATLEIEGSPPHAGKGPDPEITDAEVTGLTPARGEGTFA